MEGPGCQLTEAGRKGKREEVDRHGKASPSSQNHPTEGSARLKSGDCVIRGCFERADSLPGEM